MAKRHFIAFAFFLAIFCNGSAFSAVGLKPTVQDTVKPIDLIDLVHRIFKKKDDSLKHETPKKLNFSFIPSVGYTLTTGFAADLAGNVAFYTTRNHAENLSAIEGDLAYDTKAQRIFVVQSVIWADRNRYKFVSDLRWLRFPQSTYGLGTSKTAASENPLDFNYVKAYGTVYRQMIPDYFIGAGFKYDFHYKVAQNNLSTGEPSQFSSYGFNSTSQSAGINIDFLYDNRKNPINPIGALYVNLSLRENNRVLASQSNWRSVQLDARKYIKVSNQNNNVLAVWSLAWFTTGNVPYLDLPFTGGDVFNNTGRGYAEGRFRGKDMLYLESEFRFGLTQNGLLGGVIFANAQSFSEFGSDRFTKVAPAFGTGLRIKVNKHSRTNVCIDYGVGIYGSRGVFVNLGEIF